MNGANHRLIITGAGGFVGRMLVPRLDAAGLDLLLVGRDAARLEALWSGRACVSYEGLAEAGRGFDGLVQLAALNSDAEGEATAYQAANVELAMRVADAAQQAGIDRMVYLSSIHALDERNQTGYAHSKREAARVLGARRTPQVAVLYPAAIHGERFSVRLALLERLPKALVPAFFRLVAALRPTTHVGRLAAALVAWIGGAKIDDIITDGQSGNSVHQAARRLIDLAVVLVVLLPGPPLMALIALAIRLDSSGPAILQQVRVGRHGREFRCFKFRTMGDGTAQRASHEIGSDAVTRLGWWLRRFKLDELPQAVNILKGEMSLIGPRPCLPVQTELIAARSRRGVLDVLPGITGYSQVQGIDMSDPELLAKTDMRYLALQSLALDLAIPCKRSRRRR